MKTTSVKKSKEEAMLPNLISPDTIYTGNILAKSSIQIEGRFEGILKCSEKVIAGIKSIVKGDIEASIVQLAGTLKGKVLAENRVRIQADGNFEGVIETATLVVEEGARINGQISINREQVIVSK